MFQYAMGRTVAHRRRTLVRFDLSSLQVSPRRCYNLGVWNITATPASIRDLLPFRIAAPLERILKRTKPYYARHTVYEQSFNFDPNALNAPRNCLLRGYWQSEKYFKEIQADIRLEFTPRTAPSAKTCAISRAIRASNSVFVHIRRGDYVSEGSVNRVHGTCSLEYYRDAVACVERMVYQPHWFVFSDDPKWAQENIKLSSPVTMVDHNAPGNSHGPGMEHEDMWLMSLCRHSILANSSFSWWGAWLNPERDRIVIAPRQWFRSSRNDVRDLLPDSWLRM
jgi:hypothetical protein